MSIAEVADHAGVSLSTVSRVLSNRQRVRPETARQVWAAMRAIGYQPLRLRRDNHRSPRPHLASRMRTNRISVTTLGSVQRWLSMPVMSSVVTGITNAARELDIHVVLDEMPDPQVLSPIWQRREIDGALVFVQSGVSAQAITRLGSHLPFVWVMGAEIETVEVDHVTPDHVGVGKLAASYLTSGRCKQLAFITDAPFGLITRARGRSFLESARGAGAGATAFLQKSGSKWTFDVGVYGPNITAAPTLQSLVNQLASARPRPDGLFIPTDLLTTQIYPLLVQCGVQPERDIKIISCDNERERLDLLTPRPASIDIHGEAIGRMATRQLVQRLLWPDEPAAHVQIAPRIVGPSVAAQTSAPAGLAGSVPSATARQ